ncbi:SGNH/GDSL hydrolase family protein [Shimia ponticola]|uniref:SGNH/GDSL hydrolase family protein n=1 Tax=Shimia ponticola TaxID=2582893 RepID=UPI0011BEE05C|nr:SGNH/GDSL hydrolase family protein [Shimia ponticola]
MRLLLFILCLFVGTSVQAHDARIQVIGDSTFAWNGGLMALRLQSALGTEVDDNSISGARVTAAGFLTRLLRADVQGQADPAGRDWIVMTGGANDLGSECGCTACATTLEDLISADARRGEIMDIIRKARSAGARVIYAIYYDAPRGGGPFSACTPAFNELATRITRAANQTDGLFVVDMGDVMNPDNPKDYDSDRVHPGPQASARIAELIAATIRAAER